MGDYPQRCTAKLNELGAPLFGWICTDVVDLGEACFTCDLCGYDPIRYVHVMEHPNWSERFSVGCVCDGTMSGDMLAAQQRDDEAKRKSARKTNFMKKQWKERPDGVMFLPHTRGGITAETDTFLGRAYYKVTVNGEQYQWLNNRRVETLDEATRLAYEVLEYERKTD